MENKSVELVNFIEAYGDFFMKNFSVTQEEVEKLYEEGKYFGYPKEPGGSVWTSEGRSIYVLIRLLKPRDIIEVGNYLGRSSNFILKAVEDNGFGEVTLVDLFERLEYNKLHNHKFNRVLADSLKYLDQPLEFDLYVVDGCHEYAHVKKEMNLIIKNTTRPIWIWSHDYFQVKPNECEVGKALDEIIAENKERFKVFTPMKEKTSNCGLAIMKYE